MRRIAGAMSFAFFKGALWAGRPRQHEDGGGDDLRRQGPLVQSPLPPDLSSLSPARRRRAGRRAKVENQVGLVRERFFAPRLRFKSYDEGLTTEPDHVR
jgi:hypothetical protein